MILPPPARRPFGRIRLPIRASPRAAPLRSLSGTPRVQGILGMQRKDLRQEKEEEERMKQLKSRHKWLGALVKPPRKPTPVWIRAPLSATKRCTDPVGHIEAVQIATLDPTGARTRLFAKTNPEAAKVGDILLVRQTTGDPFSGVCINIRRQGIDTAILLRNHLTRVGVEMWYKIYSPNVQGIEVVQRRQKRARRARLYYMRQPKHDMGSVENIVAQYQRQRQALRSGGERKGRDATAGKRKHVRSK